MLPVDCGTYSAFAKCDTITESVSNVGEKWNIGISVSTNISRLQFRNMTGILKSSPWPLESSPARREDGAAVAGQFDEVKLEDQYPTSPL